MQFSETVAWTSVQVVDPVTGWYVASNGGIRVTKSGMLILAWDPFNGPYTDNTTWTMENLCSLKVGEKIGAPNREIERLSKTTFICRVTGFFRFRLPMEFIFSPQLFRHVVNPRAQKKEVEPQIS